MKSAGRHQETLGEETRAIAAWQGKAEGKYIKLYDNRSIDRRICRVASSHACASLGGEIRL